MVTSDPCLYRTVTSDPCLYRTRTKLKVKYLESGTLLSIVQAQRERLRASNEELELNNEQQRSQLHVIQVKKAPINV